ncbi:cellulase family glycosylhydrolase [Herbiconiux sp.]|uniref:cellulase family glycosylhydrolase n=1 Tax=Herbiconiux sp. TaxID=1871186 RepID=UPI0025BDE737|nr:cellulase family glycosylhydrolase [Herbiconiux sp.]
MKGSIESTPLGRVRRWGGALAAVVLVAGVVATASVASAATAGSGLSSSVLSSSVPGPKHSGVAQSGPIGGSPVPTVMPGPAAGGEGAPGSPAVPAPGPAPAPASADGAPQAALPGWLHTDGGTIVTAGGSPYVIKAVSWFGLETGNCAPHGLWSISLDAGLAQIAGWGFNTIRLPYSNECLASPASSSVNAYANPTLASLTPLQLMDAFVQRAKAYGLNVILDRHRPGSEAQSELWYTDRFPESTWISDWQMLAQRYAGEPSVIGFDLHNEPRGSACWGCGDPAVDWQAAATRAGDAVLAVNPELLIIVEGVEKQNDGSYTWWGGGLADAGSDPVTLSVPDRVVYSPHDYPASIYPQEWFTSPDYPANLPAFWDSQWGYLAKEGIAPVLVGEFGSKLQTDGDRAWFENIVAYLAGSGMSFSYWSFNPNSGDTGGLVQDDWTTPQAEKIAALSPLIGSGTAVTAPAPATGVPLPAPSPVPGTGAPATPTPSGSPGSSGTPWLKPTERIGGTAGPGAPGPRAPGATATPGATASPGAGPSTGTARPGTPGGGAGAGSASLSAVWALQSEWENGYVTEISVTNAGASSGWSISWPDAGATSVVSAWGMDCSVASGVVTCRGAQWAAFVAPGQTVTAGVQVASTTSPGTPDFTLTAR